MSTLSTLAKNFEGRTFGEMMAGLRTRKEGSLSARALSLNAGLSPAYVSKLERGEFLPTLDKFARLADCLDIEDSELVFLVRMLS